MQWLLHRMVAAALLPSTGGSPRSETKKSRLPKEPTVKLRLKYELRSRVRLLRFFDQCEEGSLVVDC